MSLLDVEKQSKPSQNRWNTLISCHTKILLLILGWGMSVGTPRWRAIASHSVGKFFHTNGRTRQPGGISNVSKRIYGEIPLYSINQEYFKARALTDFLAKIKLYHLLCL